MHPAHAATYTIWTMYGEPTLLLTDWLSKIDFQGIDTGFHNGVDAVHSLLVTCNHEPRYLELVLHTTGALALRCPRLTSLCFEISTDHSSLWPGISPQEINVGWLWSSNKLGYIKDIEDLQLLRLILRDAYEGEFDPAMHGLPALLASYFARNGKTVKIELDLRSPW